MSYGRVLVDKKYLGLVVDWLHKELERLNVGQIVVTGTSGLIPASVLMANYGIKLAYIRKPEEKNHSGTTYADWSKPFVLVDDLIVSGETIRRMLDATFPNLPVAILLYSFFPSSQCVFEYKGTAVSIISKYIITDE